MKTLFFKTIFYILVSGLSLFIPHNVLSQDKPLKQSSMEAFNNGDYSAAYEGYRQLLVSFPKDPLYKYYAGVSLVMLKRDLSEAEELLDGALSGSSLKALPADAIFYLGRARQLNGKYVEAEKSYRQFESEAGRKRAKEMDVQTLISECRAGKGMLEAPVIAGVVQKPVPSSPVVSANIQVGTDKTFVPEEKEKELDKMLENQYTADSLQRIGQDEVIKPQVQKNETTANTVSQSPVQPSQPEKEPAPENIQPAATPVPAAKDSSGSSLADSAENRIVSTPLENPAPLKQPGELRADNEPVGTEPGVFSIFSDQDAAQSKDIRINPEMPEGLVYRIQLAVFRNPVSPSYFKGLTPVEGFRAAGATVTVYYAGLFRRAEDARKALVNTRSKGFKDSFVTAMMDGKTVSAERAAVYEKEWGSRPLYKFETEQPVSKLDTVPPTLLFRVEVARAEKPLALTDVDALRKLAGNRGLDVIQLYNGNIAYLIGNFITFESADDYADLLQRNGYRDSRVVAWLGRKEIDVDTAKQLFESLQ